jgi:hypothetical protein
LLFVQAVRAELPNNQRNTSANDKNAQNDVSPADLLATLC